MFLGENSHSLDVKGRVILPVKFRDQLQEAFITSETDGCLALWPPPEFERRAQQMQDRLQGGPDERTVARFFFAGAQEVAPDRQGRLALPPSLRQFASLEREVVVNGAGDHVEIWDAARWRENKAAGERILAAG